jgi:hypothetical protein
MWWHGPGWHHIVLVFFIPFLPMIPVFSMMVMHHAVLFLDCGILLAETFHSYASEQPDDKNFLHDLV